MSEKACRLFLLSREEVMSRSMVTVAAAVVLAAVIIFSVVTWVNGITIAAQKLRSQAIAAIDGQHEKGGAQ